VLGLVDLKDPRRLPAVNQDGVELPSLPERHFVRELKPGQLGVDLLGQRPASAALCRAWPVEPRRCSGLDGPAVDRADNLDNPVLELERQVLTFPLHG
jgi:hypothetical protein